MPLSLLFDPDSFYFGVLPVIAETGKALGVAPIHVGQAALLGQMTTGFPISPLTEERVKGYLSDIVKGNVRRYCLPELGALNFVMEDSLGGGVTRSLAMDAHGKSLSFALLTLEIPEKED